MISWRRVGSRRNKVAVPRPGRLRHPRDYAEKESMYRKPSRIIGSLVAPAFALLGWSAAGAHAQVPSTPTQPSQNASQPDLNGRIDKLVTRVKKLEERPKDFWDKLNAVSGLITGGGVVLVIFLLTQWFNKKQKEAQDAADERETKRQATEDQCRRESEGAQASRQLAAVQVQTVQGFMQYLTSESPASVKAALLAIESLGNHELTTKLGTLFGGPGSLDALFRISQERAPALKDDARAAIGKIVQAYRASVVQLLRDGCLYATGFFVDSQGTVATASHIIQRIDETFTVRLSDDKEYPSRVVSNDHERDVALLRIADLRSQPLDLDTRDAPPLFEPVTTIANSGDMAWTVEVGTVASVDTNPQAHLRRIAMNMISRPGFSGAPVIDRNGRVIGMVEAYGPDTNTTFVIPAANIAVCVAELEVANRD